MMYRNSGCTAIIILALFSAARADVVLVENGQSRSAIVVPARIMEADHALTNPKFREREAETQRQRLRESVTDLARVLGVMSGTKIEIRSEDLPAGDARVPILIGERAEQKFGPPQKKAPYKQGFRYVVSPHGLGLYGESDLAASYAVYELLDRLGCRWYMPGELGEAIPEAKTISLAEADLSSAPATIFRNIWYADDAYRRRNRMGGLLLSAGHALEMYFSKEDREQHPEWKAEIGGKADPHRLRWSSASLAGALADKILALYAKDPQPSYSLSPDDGASWDESADDTALDAGDFDPTFQKISKTDRLMVLCNRVAARVAAKDPEVLLGVLAYVDYTLPPVRENVHPNIVPQLAPITYSRAHPMTDDRVPGNKDLRYLVQGWGRKARMTSMYFYGWFLAEPSAPNPMITKWGTDAPIVFANNCQFWQPETLSNFESSMHALYLGNRLAWNASLRPKDVVDELHAKFYGHASPEMAAYWTYIDRVWVDTAEYSGCGFAYLRRWTPERLAVARRLIDSARAACQTPIETRRVQLADESLALFEQFMKLRRDQAEGRFETLAEEGTAWQKKVVELGERYKDNYCFTRVHWTPHTVSGAYFKQFYQQTYDNATRIAREFEIVTAPPLRQFRYQADPDREGEAAGWGKPGFADQGWKTTDVCTETWSTLGYHDYFTSMWYRREVTLPAVAAGRRVFLWLGSFDGSVKAFVNGQAVQTTGKQESTSEVKGYCQPMSFDITAAAKAGANTLALVCTRTDFNELGTGGLLAPVVVYVEKVPKAANDAALVAAAEELFVARPLTEENSFTAGIEGPACDAAGNLYVVNLKRTGDIGRVTPDGKLDVFVELPEKSAGNGIMFDKQGMMYVADYAAHNILRIDPRTKAIDVYGHESTMNQPNDLAIAPNGTLYASDPNWGASTGQLWMLRDGGKLTRVAADMGTTNGIEVSPDGKTLYVNESVQRNIWAFAINADGTLGEKRLLKNFDDHGFDGMRCDVDGNLYVTRYGKGTVAKVSPDGAVLEEIDVLGKSPSNLCFGGPDGRTVYVTEVEHRRVVQFRVDRPGAAWQRNR